MTLLSSVLHRGLRMAAMERAELRGSVLDRRYFVGNPIGIGGTAVVFGGRSVADGTPVVIKTMRPQYARDAELKLRLRREGEVARVVPHPGIVSVLDDGVLPDRSPYLVMRRLGGESLARLLARVPLLPAEEVVALALRVGSILRAVHLHGYVHRDVKPEHVILDCDPRGNLRVSLLDFGVCASQTASLDERRGERGRVFGTPKYASPEQASGEPDVDERADVYGLSVVMFECLTGRVPFAAATVQALLRRIIREDVPPLGELVTGVERRFEEVIAKGLARRRDRRFDSVRALSSALRPLLDRPRAAERRLAARLRTKPKRSRVLHRAQISDRAAHVAA